MHALTPNDERRTGQDRRATILVVDDSAVNRALLHGILSAHYQVLDAGSGKQALSMARHSPAPDLILLDVVMPEMDGYEVMRQLRENPQTRDIPVIFITGLGDEDDEKRGLALGAVDYVTKPPRPAILLARVRNHLELKHGRDLLRNENEALESRVLERAATLRTILDSADQTIAMIAPDGAIMAINRIGAERLGAKPTALLGRNFFELLPQDSALAHRQHVLDALRSGKPTEMVDRRGGKTFATTIFPAPGDPPRVVIYADDVSNYVAAETALRAEREHLTTALHQQRELNRRLEDAQNQLLQSEKMASLGQLAAGVAHELNNPIGFVHSNLGTLEDYLNDIFAIIDVCDEAARTTDYSKVSAIKQEKDLPYLREDIFKLLSESRDGLNRVRKIVQDLKSFSRVGETAWAQTDLHAGIDSTLNIVWNELKYKCTVTKHYDSNLPLVRCLPSQLNQVFMNLLVNSAHAIQEKGEITISTERIDDDHVRLRFADNGQGISAEHIEHIFEPFFTTKPVGKGTGLGLSIAWGIVGKHHGKIEVESTEGVGTTFTITLPIDPPPDDETGSS